MRGEYKNFNDSPIPGVNAELDFTWLASIATEHAGFPDSGRLGPSERVAMLAALVSLDCARTQAIALRNLGLSISEAIREAAPEIAGAVSEAGTDIGAGLALALEQALKTFAHENTNNG